MFTLDLSINLGVIVQTLVFVATAAGVIYAMREQLKVVKNDVAEIQIEIKQIAMVLITLARQDERIKALERKNNMLG